MQPQRILLKTITIYITTVLIVLQNVSMGQDIITQNTTATVVPVSNTSPETNATSAQINSTSNMNETSLQTNTTATNETSILNNATKIETNITNAVVAPESKTSPDEAEDSPGVLCQSDNDYVGQKLGCSCKSVGGIKLAYCTSNWIGYNNTLMLPESMNISRHVRILDLSKNYLEILDEKTFGDCEGLHELILYKNQIKLVKTLTCTRIQKLDLSWNLLSNLSNDAFKSLNQLTHLDLSHNNLVIVEPFALDRLSNLQILNLASNPLGLELNLFSDYILSLDNLKNLEELDLSNTTLPDFPLSLINGTRNIKRLKLATNEITYLPEGVLHQLTSLEFLDLSGNWFETLVPFGFNGLSSLKVLVLNRMPYLTKIDKHAFAGMTNLLELSCQKNHFLSFVDVMAFRMAQELEKELVEGDCHPKIVRLADNNLNYIEYGLLNWTNMEFLELFRNPWICDCNLQWIAEFHKFKPADAAILTDSDFQCAEPHIFAGVPVAAVNPEEMLCYSPAATIAGTVGIILFAFLLFTFCSIIILNHMGMLPDCVRRYNIFGSGSSLPKYTRVNPKPTRARRMERLGVLSPEPVPGDLEWDAAGDIGQKT